MTRASSQKVCRPALAPILRSRRRSRPDRTQAAATVRRAPSRAKARPRSAPARGQGGQLLGLRRRAACARDSRTTGRPASSASAGARRVRPSSGHRAPENVTPEPEKRHRADAASPLRTTGRRRTMRSHDPPPHDTRALSRHDRRARRGRTVAARPRRGRRTRGAPPAPPAAAGAAESPQTATTPSRVRRCTTRRRGAHRQVVLRPGRQPSALARRRPCSPRRAYGRAANCAPCGASTSARRASTSRRTRRHWS